MWISPQLLKGWNQKMAALLPDQTAHHEGVGGEWRCCITPCQKWELQLWPWCVMTHCTTCLCTRSLLKITLLTDLSVDLFQYKRLHYWNSSVLVILPPGWILFSLWYCLVMLKPGSLLLSFESSSSDRVEVNGLICLVIEHDEPLWIKKGPTAGPQQIAAN